MNQVYQNSNYIIFKTDCEYIVQNINRKDFCHSHIKNYKTAKYLIDLCIHRSIPERHLNDYLLESIIRISTDNEYIKQIRQKMRRG